MTFGTMHTLTFLQHPRGVSGVGDLVPHIWVWMECCRIVWEGEADAESAQVLLERGLYCVEKEDGLICEGCERS